MCDCDTGEDDRRSCYPSSLSDEVWAVLEPLMPVRDRRKGGAARKYGDRLVLDAIFFVLRSGCQWRMVPRDLLPWDAAYRWFRAWACDRTNKPKFWITNRYYGRFNTARQDNWVFGDRASGGYLPKFAWTKIVRHYMAPRTASPDDPGLARYWADRRRKRKLPLDNGTLRLLQQQQGRCPLCEDYLLHADREPDTPREWEQWLAATRKAIAKFNLVAQGWTEPSNEFRLVHTNCYRRETGTRKQPAALQV